MSAGLGLKDTLRLVEHPSACWCRSRAAESRRSSNVIREPQQPHQRPRLDADQRLLQARERVARGAAGRGRRHRRAAGGGEQSGASAGPGALEREAPSTPPGGLDPANVRGFLAALRVPFFYWMVGPTRERARRTPGAKPTAIRGWGGVHVAVAESARRRCGSQFVVWVEGLHKPADVRLVAGGADRAAPRRRRRER